MAKAREELTHSGGFVLRTPLLPFATLDALAEGDLASNLRAMLADPAVREAVFLASPTLDERVERWLAGDETDEDEVVRPVLSYVTRMAARPTPFGLFAGCSVGTVGAETSLALEPRDTVRRHTRLDFGFLAKVVARLTADEAVQPYLTYVPNTSLYRAGARLRMAEGRVDERGMRYHRVTFEEDEALTETLDRARDGATLHDLAEPLTDDDVTIEDALAYVREIVAAQLVVSDLGPVVTGDAAVPRIVAALGKQDVTAPYGATLGAAEAELDDLDAKGLGNDPARYRDLAERLRELDPDLRVDRLFQVDLAKPGPRLVLGEDVLDELYRGIDLLHPLVRTPAEDDLGRFRDAFNARYEGRAVPLAEALDEEIGVGYGPPPAMSAEGAPLLAGVVPGGRPGAQSWTGADAQLLRLLGRALQDGAYEIEVGAADLAPLAQPDPPPLPDALSVSAVLCGDGRIVFDGAAGPSGARLLGRFCHLDERIEALVRRHVEAEEAARPDAVFAEVTHLPEGRIGNILARPVLRTYEIPFLAVSGLPVERRLPLDDLLVTVIGDRIVLRSKRLDAEVVPRITNAHNHQTGALAVYRFLGAVQHQNLAAYVHWTWGALRGAPFLPRVVSGRLVLARAQWSLAYEELEPLRKAKSVAARRAAVDALRERFRLPRRVVVSVGDNDLPVDLDTDGGRDLLGHEGRRGGLTLEELYPGPDGLVATSPEGTFAHEVVVPLVRKAPVPQAIRPSLDRAVGPDEGVEATFPPGSEWLTAKVYTGKATADLVLREVVAPLVAEVVGDGARSAADGWFFIRYGDPDHHLRLRFHGDPMRLAGEVLPRLRDALAPLLADGRVARVLLDTYRREVARYGGPDRIADAERAFGADSDAVLAIVTLAGGDEGLDLRWRAAVAGVDRLLADAGLDVPSRQAAVRHWRDALVAEQGTTGSNAKQHAGRLFRTERAALEALLSGTPEDPRALAVLAALDRRSAVQRPLLAGTDPNILGSYCHMHVNRLLRAAQRTQELVLYDLLDRCYAAAIGRAKAKQ
jgi:thiopeptide-type bacteriocin biosynthesis protein